MYQLKEPYELIDVDDDFEASDHDTALEDDRHEVAFLKATATAWSPWTPFEIKRISRFADIVNARTFRGIEPTSILGAPQFLVDRAREQLRSMFVMTADVHDFGLRIENMESMYRVVLAGFGDDAVRALGMLRGSTDPLLFSQAVFAMGAASTADGIEARRAFAHSLIDDPDASIREAARAALDMTNDIWNYQ